MGVSEQERKFIDDVRQRMAALGIEGKRLTIEYQPYMQDYSVRVSGDAVSDEQFERIMDTVLPLIYVEFEDHATMQRYLLRQAARYPAAGEGGVIGGT